MNRAARRRDADNDLLSAINLVLARLDGDQEAFLQTLSNNDQPRLISGLVDLVQLLGRFAGLDDDTVLTEFLEHAMATAVGTARPPDGEVAPGGERRA